MKKEIAVTERPEIFMEQYLAAFGNMLQPDAEGQGRRPRLGCLRGICAHAAYKSQRRINRRNSKTAHPKR